MSICPFRTLQDAPVQVPLLYGEVVFVAGILAIIFSIRYLSRNAVE
ncbi:MAG: hypothetical protein ACTSU7_06405 [Candidatus Heimdallarchaeaceae archaeon]